MTSNWSCCMAGLTNGVQQGIGGMDGGVCGRCGRSGRYAAERQYGTGAGASGSLAHAERFDYADSNLPQVAADLNEQILRIPADASGAVTLEATLFKPNARPVPLVVFNHGKNTGDLHQQPRSRPLAFAREFVRRGYAVIAPNRQGFAPGRHVPAGRLQRRQERPRAGSRRRRDGALHVARRTSMRRASSSPARRTAASYRSRMAPKPHRACAASSTSPAGCATSATAGRKPRRRVRPVRCAHGRAVARLRRQRLGVDTRRRANARRVRFAWHAGPVHRFRPLQGRRAPADRRSRRRARVVAGRQRVPRAAEFADVGALRGRGPHEPKASGYASIDSVNAVPYVDEAGREGYRRFLNQHPSRAFAVSSEGAWSGRRRRRSDGARARQLLEAGRRFVPAVCGQRPGRGTTRRRRPATTTATHATPARRRWLRADPSASFPPSPITPRPLQRLTSRLARARKIERNPWNASFYEHPA